MRYHKTMNTIYCGEHVVITGNVTCKNNCSLWHNSVVRADTAKVTLGENVNIQDLVMIHAGDGCEVTIEDNVTVGHSCILHGCTVKDTTIIGMGSIIMNNSVIGSHCIVGAGSLITQGKVFPDNCLIMGRPAKVIRPLTEEEMQHCRENAEAYVRNAKQSLKPRAL